MSADPIATLIDGVIAREGGDVVTDRPADRGGLTRAGMTITTASTLLGHTLTDAEFRALPFETIRGLYRKAFVGPFEWLPDPLRTLVVDYAVNSGESGPVTAIQQVLASTGVPLAVDGVFGSGTQHALADYLRLRSQAEMYFAVLADRIRHDIDIVVHDPAFVAFLKGSPTAQANNLRGWITRCLTFLRPVA